MCGRYVSPDMAAMERAWHLGRHNLRTPFGVRYNVAPTTQVPILRLDQDGILELAEARWGLIPPWWKKDVPPSFGFNARSEEAAQKPMWRQGLKTQRCLMPALGWYEWNEQEQVRTVSGRASNQPYYLHATENEVIAFAGIWAQWTAPSGVAVLSCALLSKEAAPSVSRIHHRMPVVLRPEQHSAWLSPKAMSAEVAELIAHPLETLTGYAVSTKVNNTRNSGEELLQPLAPM